MSLFRRGSRCGAGNSGCGMKGVFMLEVAVSCCHNLAAIPALPCRQTFCAAGVMLSCTVLQFWTS